MQESNFCFKRSNFDQALNKTWCPQCCECPKWCSTVYPKVTNQRMQSVEGYNNPNRNNIISDCWRVIGPQYGWSQPPPAKAEMVACTRANNVIWPRHGGDLLYMP